MKKQDHSAIHGDIQRVEHVNSERQFGWVFTGFFALVALLPLLHAGHVRLWALGLSLCFAAVTLTKPHFLKPLNMLWYRFGMLLHHIIGPIIMGVIFFLVITPMGWWMKCRGKKLLALEYDSKVDSYWVKRVPPGPKPETFKNQF